MSLKEDILRAFLDWNPELVEKMKNCKHAGENHYNPYHLENEIFIHSLLTYNQADSNDYIQLIMALCHDIGKVYTREVMESGKVSFFGHSEASIQDTIDFVKYLHDNDIIDYQQLVFFILHGLPVMSNHTLYYQNLHKGKYIANGDNLMLYYLEMIGKMDTAGSICKDKKVVDNVDYDEFIEREESIYHPFVYIWAGVPGSGKDYLAEQNGYPIISFDDIRVRIYKHYIETETTFDINDFDEDIIYKNAFSYCNENNIDLNGYLAKEARYYLDKGQNINICNTSLTRKARRKIINVIGTKYNYVVKQVFAPSDIIFERNRNRTNKVIPENVIKDMMKRMSICTYFEKNINKIYYIFND